MSEEVVAVEPVVVEEPACTGCEASKKVVTCNRRKCIVKIDKIMKFIELPV